MTVRACALCGTPARQPFRAPPAEMAPDLDLRPGEPARSTMRFWIQTCTECGASAPDLASLPDGARAVVEGPDYGALRGTGVADGFLRWAAIAERCGQMADAAEATLQAAWVLDDAGQDIGQDAGQDGATLRLTAVALWGPPDGPQAALRQADVLRRAGALDRAAAMLDQVGPGDESTSAILAFQRGLVAVQDRGCHSIATALRPPARRPHASHSATDAKKGFWARLRG